MSAIRVKMLSDGFIEGRRARKGKELFVYQPHMVTFRSMELFDEKDIAIVKAAHVKHAKERKTKKRHAAVVEPQLVSAKPKSELIERVEICPDTGIPLNVSTEVGVDGSPSRPLPGQPAVPVMPKKQAAPETPEQSVI